MWELGGYRQKQEIQRLVFPDGFIYDRKKDRVRTDRVNVLVNEVIYYQGVVLKIKSDKDSKRALSDLVSLVSEMSNNLQVDMKSILRYFE